VQNRCFARTGWDREIRQFCGQHDIRYQGFSLLTANPEVMQHPLVRQIAHLAEATPAQVIFSFSLAIGILPLTGTTSAEHMQQDIAAAELKLPAEAINAIEGLLG
jgi:diketogulonate reductase-like aldo/keto reductase